MAGYKYEVLHGHIAITYTIASATSVPPWQELDSHYDLLQEHKMTVDY